MNLAHVADGAPDEAVALIAGDLRLTYGELHSQVAGLRGGLTQLGIEPGDRVGLALPSSPWFVISYLAVLGVGAVAVPLNPTSPAIELGHQLSAVGAKALVVGAGAAASLAAGSGLPPIEHLVAVPGTDLAGSSDLAGLIASDPVPVVERQPDDVAALIFTAGTAGSPKAAMLSHHNLRTNIDQAQQVSARHLRADDVSFGILPLFHIFGLNVMLGMTLVAGASVVLVERFNAAQALDLVQEHRCTVVPGAPPVWAGWAALDDAPADALASVRLAVSGASKLPEGVCEVIERRFGVVVEEGYGLTEASPVVTTAGGQGAPRGSIGRPVPGVSVRLVDLDGEDALLGDSGEIWVKGPNVFLGYWEDPEATAIALTTDGWLRTGDVAVADDNGNLYIVDRSKDLIIVSGFNVFPAEVEEVLITHAGIEAVAVVGIDHPHSGETVKAYVVPAAGFTLEEAEVMAYCADHLASYKCPSSVMVVSEIPQGLGGKILRRELRESESTGEPQQARLTGTG